MIDLKIDLLGSEIDIRYQMHDFGYIEWRIVAVITGTPSIHTELLFTMIRIHYSAFIESIIQEHYHWKMEEEARAHPPDEPPF